MNLIEKLGLEKCKAIIDGGQNENKYYCTDVDEYHLCDALLSYECCINLSDIRAAIADHERTDYVSDISYHISPMTKVIDK